MIVITGFLRGDVTDVVFEPTRPRFKKDGQIILATPVHASIVPSGRDWSMEVKLTDNVELPSPTKWMYLVYEKSKQGTYMFAIPSDPATYTYAQLRRAR